MTSCDAYLKRPQSRYAAVLDMNGSRKGRWTLVSSDRKDENSNNRLLFVCVVVLIAIESHFR